MTRDEALKLAGKILGEFNPSWTYTPSEGAAVAAALIAYTAELRQGPSEYLDHAYNCIMCRSGSPSWTHLSEIPKWWS